MAKKPEASVRQQARADPKRRGRFDMKLNLADSREQVVSEFLDSFTGSHEASRMVKQILYQYKTGLDWYTGRPLYAGVGVGPTPELASQDATATAMPAIIFNQDDLDALDEDLGDWGG